MTTRRDRPPADALFAGAGEIRALCRAIDWSATPLGPPERWPHSLRLAVRMCLDARFPMAVWAGPELVLVYNDGYPPVLGAARHPWALGRPAREVWSDVWDRLGPELDRVIRHGESTVHEDERFLLRREPGGREEERFFTYSFSPIQEADGGVVGALNVFLETTGRVRSLSEREAQYRALFERAGDAILVTDPAGEGRVVSANPAACRLFGYTEEEFRTIDRAAMLDERDPAFDRLMHERERHGGAEAALTYLRKDGSRFTGELRTTFFSDARGRRLSVAIIRDVTERQRVEQALRESEERFRLLVEGVEEYAIYMLAPDGTVATWSAAAERMKGWRTEEIVGRHFSRFYAGEEARGGQPAHLLQEAATRGRAEAEGWHLRRDGSRFWSNAVLTALRGPDGALRGFAAVTRDITHRREREEALRKRELQLRVLIENVSSGVALVDATGRFTLFNNRFLSMFGLSPDSTIANVNDQDWSAWQVVDASGRLLHVDDHPVRRAARTREPVRSQLVGVRLPRSGDLIWMLVSAAPLLSARGEMEHLICTYHDITELKAAQEALVAANERLREADVRKNQFMAVLSHELRNPLAPIKNSLYILGRAVPGGDQARRAREVIERQVDQLARLVDDLLDVTRITRNKIQLQRQRLELNDLVRRTIDDHRSLFDDAGVHLDVEVGPGQVLVDADSNRVAQIVGNLLSNAAKFSGRGGRVTVSVSADARARQARIRVADTGVGIAPEMLARLFQPFMQADNTLDRSKGGLGLGLALVKGLVELHGGSVEAASAGLGRGSEFTVRLPLDLAALAASEARTGSAASPAARRRVLIIEDNADAAETLRELLEFEDHEVAVAYDGPDGIAKARALRPDVILCDIGLPGMSGYDVARALRADGALDGAVLVAISGYALAEDLQRAVDAGFAHHLRKPPTLERLKEVLGGATGGGSTA